MQSSLDERQRHSLCSKRKHWRVPQLVARHPAGAKIFPYATAPGNHTTASPLHREHSARAITVLAGRESRAYAWRGGCPLSTAHQRPLGSALKHSTLPRSLPYHRRCKHTACMPRHSQGAPLDGKRAGTQHSDKDAGQHPRWRSHAGTISKRPVPQQRKLQRNSHGHCQQCTPYSPGTSRFAGVGGAGAGPIAGW